MALLRLYDMHATQIPVPHYSLSGASAVLSLCMALTRLILLSMPGSM